MNPMPSRLPRRGPAPSPPRGSVARSGTRVTLLGPQRLQPTLSPVLESLGVEGPVATITAGWQEREPDDRELHEHLGGRSLNLMLYQRAERVFARDPELSAAHQRRQARLRELQDLYNVRLDHLMAAAYELQRRPGATELLSQARVDAIEAIRSLDAQHLQRVRDLHGEYDQRWQPGERETVIRERREVEAMVRDAPAVAVAGGHVAILLNRLRLFGLEQLAAGKVLVAWSAGAMAISERVVLFHDHPAHGMGNAEVLEVGLGFAPGIVPLPHARTRLRLEDRDRVGVFAARFAPAICVPMNEGARLDATPQGWAPAPGTEQLQTDGRVGEAGAA